jgi:hypothetical protein
MVKAVSSALARISLFGILATIHHTSNHSSVYLFLVLSSRATPATQEGASQGCSGYVKTRKLAGGVWTPAAGAKQLDSLS